MKIKNFCTSGYRIDRVKMQPTEWEKCDCGVGAGRGHRGENGDGEKRMGEMLASHISDKRLISRVYRELLKFNNKKQKPKPNNSIQKMGKGLA